LRGNNGDINMTTTVQKRGTKHQILEIIGEAAFHGIRSGPALEIVARPLSNEVTEKEKETTIVKGPRLCLFLYFSCFVGQSTGSTDPRLERQLTNQLPIIADPNSANATLKD
jgi:hypothetical protein